MTGNDRKPGDPTTPAAADDTASATKADGQAPAPEAKAREAGREPSAAPRDDKQARDAMHRPGLTAMTPQDADEGDTRRWVVPAAIAVGAVVIFLIIVALL